MRKNAVFRSYTRTHCRFCCVPIFKSFPLHLISLNMYVNNMFRCFSIRLRINFLPFCVPFALLHSIPLRDRQRASRLSHNDGLSCSRYCDARECALHRPIRKQQRAHAHKMKTKKPAPIETYYKKCREHGDEHTYSGRERKNLQAIRWVIFVFLRNANGILAIISIIALQFLFLCGGMVGAHAHSLACARSTYVHIVICCCGATMVL